jgi:hypothetical protein
VVHQLGKKDRVERKVKKSKTRDLPLMLRSKYLSFSLNDMPKGEGKPQWPHNPSFQGFVFTTSNHVLYDEYFRSF